MHVDVLGRRIGCEFIDPHQRWMSIKIVYKSAEAHRSAVSARARITCGYRTGCAITRLFTYGGMWLKVMGSPVVFEQRRP